MRGVATALAALATLGAAAEVRAGAILGTVFFDADGDGAFDAGEEPAPGVAVYWGRDLRTVTDEDGRYSFDAPDGEAIVWAHTPDTAAPGPVHRRVPAAGATDVDLALTAIAPAPLRFAVVSDLHTGQPTIPTDDIASALLPIDDQPEPLSFIVATGDLTQGNQPEQFAALGEMLLALHTPFVPVPGNHDWYDGGATYRSVFGPASYSFDQGGLRFVVLSDQLNQPDQLAAFLELVVADAGDRHVVAFRHAPPVGELVAVLEDAGVDTLFTGHFHANRVLRHDALVELNTQPLAMAGIDTTPGGYRLVELGEDGQLTQVPVTVTSVPLARASPLPLSPPPELTLRDWPQLQGGPERRGTHEIELTPPLAVAWATDLGEHLHGGQVIVADGVVLVSIADFGDGGSGGVVALDGATGAQLWRHRGGASVRNAAAVAAGVAVVSELDGSVRALELATGAELWSLEVAPTLEPQYRSLYAAPLIVDGVVYAGNQRELVALDLHTGDLLWAASPHDAGGFYGSSSSPAAADGLVVASFAGGGNGVMAFDAATGERVWTSAEHVSQGMLASPVIAGDTVYAIDWLTNLRALDLASGAISWERRIDDDSYSYAYGAVGTPALADGVLYVGTQHGSLHAIDTLAGVELWRADTEVGYLRAAHYQGRAAAVPASPVVTGALVWFAGNDGVLRAHEVITGHRVGQLELGAAVTMAPAPAGDALIVASYDGVVRALVPVAPPKVGEAGSGCSCSTAAPGSWWPAVLALIALRRRRSRE